MLLSHVVITGNQDCHVVITVTETPHVVITVMLLSQVTKPTILFTGNEDCHVVITVTEITMLLSQLCCYHMLLSQVTKTVMLL